MKCDMKCIDYEQSLLKPGIEQNGMNLKRMCIKDCDTP